MSNDSATGEPLLVIRASRLASARKRGLGAATLASARPVEVRIFEDRIEEHQPGLPGRRTVKTLRYEQIAQVAVRKGLRWSTLSIESTGGHAITAEHLSRDDAEQAKMLIDERLNQAGRARGGAPLASPSTAEELQRLADLHQQKALTDDEFAAAKQKLLNIN